jgi:hypothetical protein
MADAACAEQQVVGGETPQHRFAPGGGLHCIDVDFSARWYYGDARLKTYCL